jgi:hypothetical protein
MVSIGLQGARVSRCRPSSKNTELMQMLGTRRSGRYSGLLAKFDIAASGESGLFVIK